MIEKRELIGVILMVTILAILPVLTRNLPQFLSLMTIGLSYSIIVSNWNLLYGFAGIWSFGQLAFFGIGAYASALLSLSGYSPWISLLIGIGISLSVALAISAITLRIKVDAVYFALASLGLAEVVRGVVIMIEPGCLYNIPSLKIGEFSFSLYGRIPYYYAFLIVLVASLFIHKKILISKIGLATIALRDSEARAMSLGVEPLKVRTFLFIISVIFTSLSGSLYVHYTNGLSHVIMGYDILLSFIIILAFGGLGTFYGPIAASFLWVFLDFILRVHVESIRLIIMGAIVVLSLLYTNRGITEVYDKIVTYFNTHYKKG